uniref:Uncharacterized protein n=1 Tax=Chenopodium quinoa TaxID=63459 RepID=A0A803LUF8_CHEQI
MADEEQDPLAFITENCRYSSSQEELLSHAKFAREDETFPDEDESPAVESSGVILRKLDGAYDSGMKGGGELAAGVANPGTPKNLGFRGERKGETSGTKLEGVCGGEKEIEAQLKGRESEIEPQLKKYKVSPLVHCTGKMVIEGENDGGEVVVFSGDLKVEKVSSLRPVVPESAVCTEKLDDDVHVEGEQRAGSGVMKKLEFDMETEVINVEEEGEIVEIVDKEGGDHGLGKRELPRSMFGLVWGEGTGDLIGNEDMKGGSKEANLEGEKDGEPKGDQEEVCGEGNGELIGNVDVKGGSKEANLEGEKDGESKGDQEEVCGEGNGGANENVVVENSNVERDSKEASVQGNRDEKSKGGEEEAMRCILDVLRMLVSDKCSNDDGEVDILETAKRHGMTFPRSRFLPEVDE